MKKIVDWLEEKLNEGGVENDVSSIEQQAEFLRADAEAAGYSGEELVDACGGDIAEFIRTRYGANVDGSSDQNRVVDPFLIPLAPLAIRQE